jgi:hypothetical protein
MLLIGAPGSTALSADGFQWILGPEGTQTDKPCIVVTYKVDRVAVANGSKTTAFNTAFNAGARYNPDAGYEVYHLVYP